MTSCFPRPIKKNKMDQQVLSQLVSNVSHGGGANTWLPMTSSHAHACHLRHKFRPLSLSLSCDLCDSRQGTSPNKRFQEEQFKQTL